MLVEELTDEQTTERRCQHAPGVCQTEYCIVKPQFVLHGFDKEAEDWASHGRGSCINENHRHDYVPAVVDSGFPVDGFIHIRLIDCLFDELGKNIRAKNVQLLHGFFRLAQGAHHELGRASVHISLNGLAYCF